MACADDFYQQDTAHAHPSANGHTPPSPCRHISPLFTRPPPTSPTFHLSLPPCSLAPLCPVPLPLHSYHHPPTSSTTTTTHNNSINSIQPSYRLPASVSPLLQSRACLCPCFPACGVGGCRDTDGITTGCPHAPNTLLSTRPNFPGPSSTEDGNLASLSLVCSGGLLIISPSPAFRAQRTTSLVVPVCLYIVFRLCAAPPSPETRQPLSSTARFSPRLAPILGAGFVARAYRSQLPGSRLVLAR